MVDVRTVSLQCAGGNEERTTSPSQCHESLFCRLNTFSPRCQTPSKPERQMREFILVLRYTEHWTGLSNQVKAVCETLRTQLDADYLELPAQ